MDAQVPDIDVPLSTPENWTGCGVITQPKVTLVPSTVPFTVPFEQSVLVISTGPLKDSPVWT